MASSDQDHPSRVYLDNAATSWPKSDAVLAAVNEFIHSCGATSGRGAYASALEADRWLEAARTNLASLFRARSGEEVACCTSGTHALNAALWGLLRKGDHVVTTSMEHNSVLRPLKNLEDLLGIQFDVAEADRQGRSSADAARDLVRENTAWLVVGHASNVTGSVNDLNKWSDLARETGARLMVDASQTLGYIPLDVVQVGIDVLAAAGHKGIGGLAGTGLLFVTRELHEQFRPLMSGGTGKVSESIDHQPVWPQSVEVGNLNLPGVVSMAEAAAGLLAVQDLRVGWLPVFQQLVEGLKELSSVHLVGFDADPDWSRRIPVVGITVDDWDVHDLAAVLDTSFQIEVRAGWHCAALVHDVVGSSDTSGTLRLSPGRSTTSDEVEYVLNAIREVLC